MKKIVLPFLFIAIFISSCTNNAEKVSSNGSGVVDSLSMAIGQLLAVDCYKSNLIYHSDQIEKAVDDVINGRIGNIYQAYAYVNAADIVSKSYAQLHQGLDPEVIKKSANEVLEKCRDSISHLELELMQQGANEYIMSYFDVQFVRETEQFLKDVDNNEGAKKTENGIRYKIIKKGEGTISSTDKVDVIYTLYNYNGKIIDSNESSGNPLHVELPNGVVPGFAQSIQLVGVGGKVKVWIPAELGYGDEGSAPEIQPGQVLVFSIEVVKKY